jgi:hypothetical protein
MVEVGATHVLLQDKEAPLFSYSQHVRFLVSQEHSIVMEYISSIEMMNMRIGFGQSLFNTVRNLYEYGHRNGNQ